MAKQLVDDKNLSIQMLQFIAHHNTCKSLKGSSALGKLEKNHKKTVNK